MPFVPDDKREFGLLTLPPNPDVGISNTPGPVSFVEDIVPAFFQTEIGIGSLFSRIGTMPERGVQNPDYDPFSRIKGTDLEAEAKAFIDVDTDEEFGLVRNRLHRQMRQRGELARANGLQIAGMFALGMLDPLILFPVGQAAAYSRNIGLLKRGLLTARAGMFGITAQEAMLQSTQDYRTWGETAFTIGAGTVLSGILGGTLEAFHLGAETARALGVTPEAVDAARIRLTREAEAVVESDLGAPLIAGASGGDTPIYVPKVYSLETNAQAMEWGIYDPNSYPLFTDRPDIPRAVTIHARGGDVGPALGFDDSGKIIAATQPGYEGRNLSEIVGEELAGKMTKATKAGRVEAARVESGASAGNDLTVRESPFTMDEWRRRGAFLKTPVSGGAGSGAAAAAPYVPPPGRLRQQGPFGLRVASPLPPLPVRLATDELRTLPAWGGLDKVLSRFTPMIQVLTGSGELLARELAVRLARVPQFVKTSQALPHSVEALADQHYRGLATGIIDTRNQFAQYSLGRDAKVLDWQLAGRQLREGLTGKRSDLRKMTFREFREEVGFALNAGDRHVIPEVEAAAKSYRKNVLQPLLDRAVEVGLADDALLTAMVKGADSYFPRHYRITEINARRGEFADLIHQHNIVKYGHIPKDIISAAALGKAATEEQTAWLKNAGIKWDEVPAKTAEIHAHFNAETRRLTDDAIDNIISMNPDRISFAGSAKPLGRAFAHREMDIPSVLIRDFLEWDAEQVMRAYVRGAAREIEMHGAFGSTTLQKELEAVSDSYRIRLANVLPNSPEAAAIAKERKLTMESLETLRDLVLGTYGIPPNPDSLIIRGARFARQLNFVTLGGGFAINSIADVGNMMMLRGANRMLGPMFKYLISDFKEFKGRLKNLSHEANIFEVVLNSRVNQTYEIAAGIQSHTKIERGMGSLSQNMSLLNLQAHWNQGAKSIAALMGSRGYYDMGLAARLGKLTKKELAWLDRVGIESRELTPGQPSMLERITRQFEQFKEEKHGVIFPEIAKWQDKEAKEYFRIAISGDANRIIVTPEAADIPAWMSREGGKFFSQFKSFQMATTTKILLANMQMPDAQYLSGLSYSIFMGSMVYAIRRSMNDQPLSDNPLVWIKEGIDRSGQTGFFFDINNMIERGTGGSMGISRLIGGPISSRYASLNAAGSLMGPTSGQLQNIYQILAATGKMDFDPTDAKAIRRLIPYQNVFYTEKLFDLFQDGLAQTIVSDETMRRARRRQGRNRPLRLEANP